MARPILLAFFIAFFNQLTGINTVLYFSPRIFQMTGLGSQAALLQSVGIGITNLLFTFAGLWFIDRLRRQTLLYIGSAGYILSLGTISWAFATGRMVLQLILVTLFVPETKGIALEEMEMKLAGGEPS